MDKLGFSSFVNRISQNYFESITPEQKTQFLIKEILKDLPAKKVSLPTNAYNVIISTNSSFRKELDDSSADLQAQLQADLNNLQETLKTNLDNLIVPNEDDSSNP